MFERVLLLLVAFICFSCCTSNSIVDDDLLLMENSVIDIYPLSSDVIVLGSISEDVFSFSCNATSDYTISLIIDYTFDSPKLAKVTNKTKASDNTVDFYYSMLDRYDNGTTFLCAASPKGMTDLSNFTDVLVLQVLYAPVFVEGSNVSLLSELPTDKDRTLECTVSMSNPPITAIKFTNNSKHFSNINTEIKDNSVGKINFAKAQVNNKGDYTCSASNGIGTTTLTYNTYIGGVPDKISVFPNVTSHNQLKIYFNITDKSDAPAVSLQVSIGQFFIKVIKFQSENLTIPVQVDSYKAIEEDLDRIEASNYTMIITAFNLLGNYTIYNGTIFIPGTGMMVNISSSMTNVTQGNNYTFNCTSDHNATFTVQLDYSNKTNERIIEGKKGKTFTEFTFINTTYRDNGTVLQCIANNMYKSVTSHVVVLYPPIYYNGTQELLIGRNGSSNVTINIPDFTSNPPPTNYTWYRNGKKMESNKRITIVNATALLFNPLLQEDYGNYTVRAENEQGKGNGTANIDVQWPPYLLSPVMIPYQMAGKSYEVVLNVSANPDISFPQWMKDNKFINDTNIIEGFTTLTFTSLRPVDNGSYSVILYNGVGNDSLNIDFNMIVYYAPVISITSTSVGAFLYSKETVHVLIDANPSNYTYEWMKGGKKIKSTDNVEIDQSSITFKNISMTDIGMYSISVSNMIGNASISFTLSVYDGPFFKEGNPNSTLIMEHESDTDVNITCTVKSSVPPVDKLMIEPSKGDNWKTVKSTNDSVTVVITKANAKSNTRKFTCSAMNNITTSTLTFNNFIGGVPNKMTVDVMKSVDDNTVKLSFKVTDSSDAPATELLVFLKETMSKNKTFPINGYPLNGATISIKDGITEKYDDLGAGTHIVKIYGGNLIGRVHLKDYNFTSPSVKPTKHSSSKTGVIVGVTIPILILVIVIIVGVVGFFYYKKRRGAGEYAPLSVQDGNNSYGAD